MMVNLWCYGGAERKRYFIITPVICEVCKRELDPGMVAFLLVDWNPLKPQEMVFCQSCLREENVPPNFHMQERKVCLVLEEPGLLPPGSFPVRIVYPGLSDCKGGLSLFQAASQRVAPVEKVVDRTRLAGRPEITFSPEMQIGVVDRALLDHLDRPLETVEGLVLLDRLASAKPVIEEREKKLLEDDRVGLYG